MTKDLSLDQAKQLVAKMKGKHVVVVGDVMLDEYVRGDVARISPEAPVPVVDLTERWMSPGGAANTAANIVSLGGHATLVGLMGNDSAGASLKGALRDRGIDTEALVVTGQRPTTHKLRIVARTQQIVRVDVETRGPLSRELESEIEDVVRGLAAQASAFVLSDYAKGVVSDAVARAVIAVAKTRGLPVVADPKGRAYAKYAGSTVITPNVHELEDVTGVSTHNVDGPVVEAAKRLLPELDGTAVLVTRGAHGMTLVAPESEPLHLPTMARTVYDVTGAGDTVVGMLTLALAAKVPYAEALTLATRAASIAVSRAGTVAVEAGELVQSYDS